MEEFNLNKHTVEEIPGKFININGIRYIFRNKIKEGENAHVYLLQHAQSGYSRFIGKVLKLDNRSELYQQISRSKVDGSFALNIQTNSSIGLHTEIYEVNGTLLKFQESLAGLQPDEEDAYQPALMNLARQHYSNNELAEAINVYEQVLTHNPYHIDALINIVGPYASSGEVSKAIKSVLRAIEIDPNYRASYRQLSNIFLAENNHENAIGALEMSLDRWAYDSEILNEVIDICLDYDLMDLAVAKIAFIHNYLGWSVEEYLSHNPELKEKIIASQYRIRDYKRLLAQAQQYQHDKHYEEAENILAQAVEVSKNNLVAEYNLYVCQFHLGVRAIMGPLVRLSMRTNEPIRKSHCELLCLLCAVDVKGYPLALNIVETLTGKLRDGSMTMYDLPRIPLYYYDFYAIEELSLEPVLSRLRILIDNFEHQENINFLYQNYLQFSRESA